jgi:hypothetical protein
MRKLKLTAQYYYRFTPEQYAKLLELAAATNSVAKAGPTARQPSVAAMFGRIADDQLLVTEREPWTKPAWLDEAADKVEAEQRAEQERLEQERLEQERILEQQRRVAEQAKSQRKTPAVKLEQLDMLTELEPA